MPWSEWVDLGRSIKWSPAVSTWGPGRLDAFGIDSSTNRLLHNAYEGGRWQGWEDLGDTWTSAPAAVSWGPGRIDIAVRGTDNALYHMANDRGWGQWENLGGTFTREPWLPGIGTPGPNRLDVFGIADDGSMGYQLFDGTGWTEWVYHPGTFTAGPWVISAPGAMVVTARDEASTPLYRVWDGDWSTWERMVDPTGPEAPVLAAISGWLQAERRNGLELIGGRVDMFLLGADGQLRRFTQILGEEPVEPEILGGPVTSVAAASWGPDRLDVLATGQDGRLYHRSWTAAGQPEPSRPVPEPARPTPETARPGLKPSRPGLGSPIRLAGGVHANTFADPDISHWLIDANQGVWLLKATGQPAASLEALIQEGAMAEVTGHLERPYPVGWSVIVTGAARFTPPASWRRYQAPRPSPAFAWRPFRRL